MGRLLSSSRVERFLAVRNWSALVATTYQNVYYASGFLSFGQPRRRSTQVYAVLARNGLDRTAVVLPVTEVDRAAESHLDDVELFPYGNFYIEPGPAAQEPDRQLLQWGIEKAPWHTPEDALAAAFRYVGTTEGKVGIDEEGIAATVLEAACERLPGVEFESAALTWRTIRAVKNNEEVRRLQEATLITERAIQAALAGACDGVTEREMANLFEMALIRENAHQLLTVIAFGSHAAFPNALPGNRQLAHGDVIRFDVGCVYENYCADIARCATLGEPSSKQRSYYRAILCGEEAAFETIRPGVAASRVFEAAVQTTRQAGIPHYRRHHVGHGIGLETYELPLMTAGQEMLLEEGMVLEIETPYYEIGFGGLQVEDTVLVTSDGFRLLTASDRGLAIL